jgi:tRNA(Arg) A34 adenosine deaminase TadA
MGKFVTSFAISFSEYEKYFMISERDKKFLERAIALSRKGMSGGKGGPFGCVVVQGDEIVGEGCNEVTSSNDPTAHAEVVAIRMLVICSTVFN